MKYILTIISLFCLFNFIFVINDFLDTQSSNINDSTNLEKNEPLDNTIIDSQLMTHLYFQNNIIKLEINIIFNEINRKLTENEACDLIITLRQKTNDTIFPHTLSEQRELLSKIEEMIAQKLNAKIVICKFG